jgi:Spy/CpxP family protein refolding chaperone
MRPQRLWLLASLLALTVSPARAQNPPRGRGPGGRMELLFKDITLTAEQQAKVDSIRAHYRAQMPSFTPGSPPDSATREKIRGLFRRQVDDLRAVLTADQQKTFDKNVAEMREGRRGGP